MQTPQVSIIIPVYNDWARLLTCLNALHNQMNDQIEIIVVDNGSTQRDEQAIAHIQNLPNTTLIIESKTGSYAARNAGLRAARGEFIGFTDADCIPANDWIRSGLYAVKHLDRPGVVAGPVDIFAQDPDRPNWVELYDMINGWPIDEYVDRWQFGVTANLFTHRDVIGQIGRFNESLKSGGDSEWCKRAYAKGVPVVYNDAMRICHPALQTIHAVWKKARRVGGGLHDIYVRDAPAISYFYRSFPLDLLPPFRTTSTILRTPSLNPAQKMGAILVGWVYNYGRTYERVRLVVSNGTSARS